MNKWHTVLLMFLIVAIIAGCQQNETVETDTNVEEEQDHENDKGDETNSVSGLPSGEKVDFEGSNTELQSSDLDPKQLEVELEGEVFSTDDHIIIEGKSNLVPGAEISASLQAVGYIMMGSYSGKGEVANDGTFEVRIKNPNVNTMLIVEMEMIPRRQKDTIKQFYGSIGEHLKGNHVYKYDDSGEFKNRVYAKGYLLKKEGEHNRTELFTSQGNPPSDYGDYDVWIDVTDVSQDDHFIYILGESNLLEGSRVEGSLKSSRYILANYRGSTLVHPDGSFFIVISNPKKPGLELNIKYDRFNQWKSISKYYGSNGENLTGNLVYSKDGRSWVEYHLKLQQ